MSEEEVLNDREEEILSKLVNPDEPKLTKFKWDENYQRRLIGLLLTDQPFMIQAQSLIKPDYFSSEVHVDLCKFAYKYFDKYRNVPPRFIIEQALKEVVAKRDNAIRLYYQVEIENIYDAFIPEILVREPLLDEVVNFAKIQALKTAMNKAQKELKKDQQDEEVWNRVYEYFKEAMLVDKNYDMGLEFFTNIDEFFDRLLKSESVVEKFSTGFRAIDNALTGGTMRRKALYSWIGLSGTGKSLALVKAAVENVKLNKKVLYISLEMSEEDITQRFASIFANVSFNFLPLHKDKVKDLAQVHVNGELDKRLFLVKQFPGGEANVNDIRSFITQCQLYGFVPDLVIVDYVGEMKEDPGVQGWEAKYRIMRDLRGLAVVYNMCFMTCIQPNRGAVDLKESDVITDSNIGGSFDQIKPLDGLWSLNQTVVEKNAGVGRVFTIKHRNGRSKFMFWVKFDYNTLSIEESSENEYNMLMNQQSVVAATKIAMDTKDTPSKFKKKKNNTGDFSSDD